MVDLTREGSVFVLRLKGGENRLRPELLEALGPALDEVERAEGAAALVTVGEGKHWSTGLDLEWMAGEGRDRAGPFLGEVLRLLARVLALPVPTVAALNGHAFAAGAMLALAHDLRVMREDRGFFCLPEADLGLPLQPGMTALVRARLAPQVAHEAIVTARRFGGREAAARGIVDRAVPEAEVLPTATKLAAELAGKPREALAALKRGLYAEALRALEAGPAEG